MSEHAIANAKGWLDSIREMVTVIGEAEESGDDAKTEKAREAVQEAPLSVRVRDDWRAVGSDPTGPLEYEILLSTGGPALRIYGQLTEHNEPALDPQLQWQDWGAPWTDYPLETVEREAVASFAAQFYFGEG